MADERKKRQDAAPAKMVAFYFIYVNMILGRATSPGVDYARRLVRW